MGGPLLDSNTSRIGPPNLRALATHSIKGYQKDVIRFARAPFVPFDKAGGDGRRSHSFREPFFGTNPF